MTKNNKLKPASELAEEIDMINSLSLSGLHDAQMNDIAERIRVSKMIRKIYVYDPLKCVLEELKEKGYKVRSLGRDNLKYVRNVYSVEW